MADSNWWSTSANESLMLFDIARGLVFRVFYFLVRLFGFELLLLLTSSSKSSITGSIFGSDTRFTSSLTRGKLAVILFGASS